MSEAKQEVKTVPEVQYVKSKIENVTDEASFNAYAFVTLSDGQSVGIQATGRHGISAEEMYKDFKSFVAFLDLCATDHAVKFVDKRNGTYPSEAQTGKTGQVANNGGSEPEKKPRKWDEPVPQAELPAELAEVTVNIFTQDFDVVKVLPQPDDKATVEFWKDGMKFAVGAKINKGKYDTIKQYLATLTEQKIDPAKAGEYRIAGVQYWTEGAEYEYEGKKKHYKNICLLKPAL